MSTPQPTVAFSHVSVMLNEAVEGWFSRADGIYVDGTFGRGGHSRELLRPLSPPGRLIAFAIYMPLIGASMGLLLGWSIGMNAVDTALLATLAASASYIAAPAAMRLALPEANPGLTLPLAIGVTFPFNLIVGIPLYLELAKLVAGS